MSEAARERILGRLRRAAPLAGAAELSGPDFGVMDRAAAIPTESRYARLKAAMEAVQAEFLETTRERWPEDLLDFAAAGGIATIAFGAETDAGKRLASASASASAARGGKGPTSPKLVAYDRPIEEWKRRLFEDVGAGFTTTRGGIAETGGLILWPSPQEPRLLSLVPPVHFALLDTAAIHATFFDAVRSEGWARAMPANALLISGPSKTADIEQTLAYGVHGPKRLVVVAVR